MMKAVRLMKIGEPLKSQELPSPAVSDREVLVRVKAAGICHSDAHYRSGVSMPGSLPVTLGHEIAGVVEEVGKRVSNVKAGDRVCLHYMVTCGECYYCNRGREHFCTQGKMLGKQRDGGFAEYVVTFAHRVVPLPELIPFEQGAIMMCSSATSIHALHRARLQPGETVAIFGVGGLGMSAIQLAKAFGALEIYAVDINAEKLELAEMYGAISVNAARVDPVTEIRRLTNNRGVDVALELIGLPRTMRQAVQCLAVFGRAALAGITDKPLEIDTYRELLGKEAEVIGSACHTITELYTLIGLARRGKLDLAGAITRTIPLDARLINETLDELDSFSGGVRTVIVP